MFRRIFPPIRMGDIGAAEDAFQLVQLHNEGNLLR
jgi:hypothetical protein